MGYRGYRGGPQAGRVAWVKLPWRSLVGSGPRLRRLSRSPAGVRHLLRDKLCLATRIPAVFEVRRTVAKALLLIVAAWASLTILDGVHDSASAAQTDSAAGIELGATVLAAAGAGLILRRALSVRPASRLARSLTACVQERPIVHYLWPYPPGAPRIALSHIIRV